MAKNKRTASLIDRPSQPKQWVGLKQLDRWKRDAAPAQYANRGFDVLTAAGKVSRQEYLEMIYDMERDFPGYGWQDQGAQLYAWYGKRNLKLKELPQFREIAADPQS